jgi:hypothetical protein
VSDVRTHLQQVAKIVGVSDDLDEVQRCEAEAQAEFGQRATANRSQPYYLDVTNKNANKGAEMELPTGEEDSAATLANHALMEDQVNNLTRFD